jgi:hypothetical protein
MAPRAIGCVLQRRSVPRRRDLLLSPAFLCYVHSQAHGSITRRMRPGSTEAAAGVAAYRRLLAKLPMRSQLRTLRPRADRTKQAIAALR